MSDKTETKDAKPKIVAKYVGTGFLPGVPGRDLDEVDMAELGPDEMEILRRDAEGEYPHYEHAKSLGHSEQWKAAREREREAKAAEKTAEKKEG